MSSKKYFFGLSLTTTYYLEHTSHHGGSFKKFTCGQEFERLTCPKFVHKKSRIENFQESKNGKLKVNELYLNFLVQGVLT